MAEEAHDDESPIRAGQVVPPVLRRRAFHCPHCGVYASQRWRPLQVQHGGSWDDSGVEMGTCFNCQVPTIWIDAGNDTDSDEENPGAILIWPVGASGAPRAHQDMPADAAADYTEARDIVERSPRGATALLRLAAQKLMVDLGESGKNINDDIASLVRKGLPVEIQQALDALRVIGNNAVHPGDLDLKDDRETAVALFGILNYIVEQRITQPMKLEALYAKVPSGAVKAIEKRDGRS